LWPFLIWFGDLLTRKPPDLRRWFMTKPTQQVPSSSMTIRLGLPVAENKASLVWFIKTKFDLLEILNTDWTASRSEGIRRWEYPIAGQSISRSDLLFAIQDARLPPQVPNFSGKTSLYDARTSLNFDVAAQISVIANTAVRQTPTIGELTWQN